MVCTGLLSFETAVAAKFEDHLDAINFTCSHPDLYYYALPGSRCSEYYRCNKDRTRLVLDCPPGATFDFFKQVCTREAGE